MKKSGSTGSKNNTRGPFFAHLSYYYLFHILLISQRKSVLFILHCSINENCMWIRLESRIQQKRRKKNYQNFSHCLWLIIQKVFLLSDISTCRFKFSSFIENIKSQNLDCIDWFQMNRSFFWNFFLFIRLLVESIIARLY